MAIISFLMGTLIILETGKIEVLQDNLDDTKTAIRELKNIFVQIDDKLKNEN